MASSTGIPVIQFLLFVLRKILIPVVLLTLLHQAVVGSTAPTDCTYSSTTNRCTVSWTGITTTGIHSSSLLHQTLAKLRDSKTAVCLWEGTKAMLTIQGSLSTDNYFRGVTRSVHISITGAAALPVISYGAQPPFACNDSVAKGCNRVVQAAVQVNSYSMWMDGSVYGFPTTQTQLQGLQSEGHRRQMITTEQNFKRNLAWHEQPPFPPTAPRPQPPSPMPPPSPPQYRPQNATVHLCLPSDRSPMEISFLQDIQVRDIPYKVNCLADKVIKMASMPRNITIKDFQQLWWPMDCVKSSIELDDVLTTDVMKALPWDIPLTQVALALHDFVIADGICAMRTNTSCTAPVTEQQVKAYTTLPADTATCGTEMLLSLGNCCEGEAVANYTGAGLSGVLPTNFVPAGYTSFMDNPELCGVITKFPFDNTTKRVAIPKLYNSQVILDLGALSKVTNDEYVMTHIVEDLGARLLASNNLQGVVADSNAVRACALLETGKYANLKWDTSKYKCNGDSPVYSARWDKWCYSYQYVSFDSTLRQLRALAEYNEYQSQHVPAFMCGDEGKQYRGKGLDMFWGISMTVMTVLVGITMYFTTPHGQRVLNAMLQGVGMSWAIGSAEWLSDSRWYHYLSALVQAGLFIYDEASDWVFIRENADYGNVVATATLGWLMLIKNFFLYCFGWMIILGLDRFGWIVGGGILAFFAFIYIVLMMVLAGASAVTLTGDVTYSQYLQFPRRSVFCEQDAMLLFGFFVGLSVLGIGAGVLITCCLAFGYHPFSIVHKTQYSAAAVRTSNVAFGVYSLLMHDLPQAIAQAVMWKSGYALVRMTTYVQSAAPAVIRVGMQVYTLWWYALAWYHGDLGSSSKIHPEPNNM